MNIYNQTEMHTHASAQYLSTSLFVLWVLFCFFPQLTHLVRFTCVQTILCFRRLNCRSELKRNLKPGSVALHSFIYSLINAFIPSFIQSGSSTQSIHLPPFFPPLNKRKTNQHSTETNNNNNSKHKSNYYNVFFKPAIACVLRRFLFVFRLLCVSCPPETERN